MRAARPARLAWGLFALTLIIAGAAVALLVANGARSIPGTFGLPGFAAVAAVIFGVVGALVASRRPGNPIGWLFCATALGSALQELAEQYGIHGILVRPGSLPAAAVGAWLPTWIWLPVTATQVLYLPLLFPDGRLPSRRWRAVAWIGTIGIVTGSISLALAAGPLENIRVVDNPFGVLDRSLAAVIDVGFVAYPVAALLAIVSLLRRFRRSRGDERQQIKWILAAGAFTVAALLAAITVSIALARSGGSPAETPLVLELLMVAGFLTIPVAAGVAILRHGLYEIDVVISKTVVYGVLAAFITAIYVALVVGVGSLIGRRASPVLSALAAAIAALAFQPVRRWAQRLANRVVYGDRATPYEVLAEFSDRVGAVFSTDDVLPRMARVVADGTGATRAEVWLRVGDQVNRSAVWPAGDREPVRLRLDAGTLPPLPDADRVYPIEHRGELLGAYAIRKAAGDPLTPAEDKLLADLASQAGLVLRNVRLTEELRQTVAALQGSRKRIVAAQDDERRRLERDIHDGAQQHLVALMVKVRVLESLARKSPEKVADALAALKAEANEALENLRDLARGIYPPLLADQGLAAALEAQARKAALPVRIDRDGVGRYPAEAEAAVYFCVLEALQNVAKYADAREALVALRASDGALTFTVTDDGRGFDPATRRRGSGLQNMADRVEALGGSLEVDSRPGGGTTVRGRIPVGAQP